MYSKKNYYDERGRLILAKDMRLTKTVRQKLSKFHIVDESGYYANAQVEGILQTNIPVNLHCFDNTLFDLPADIVNRILLESRSEPWGMIIRALFHHIDWIYTHSINVSLISLMIAIKLGYTQQELYEIALGAMLHDVGKLLIPKSIIYKKDTLTEQEKLLIQQHCDLGMEMIAEYDLSKASCLVIHQHHERNDGSGYPLHLTGTQIHPYAKVVMTADVFDAASSFRPYRPSKNPDEVMRILKEPDTLFCQDLVNILESLTKSK